LKNNIELKKLFWEYEFREEELQAILKGAKKRAGHLDQTTLFSRMLSSLGWYSILDLVGRERLNDLLSDSVLRKIHSKDLQRKYAAAKRVLFQ